MKPMKYTSRTAFLSCVHFLVDFSCALVLFSRFYGADHWALALLFYNFCAFALQLPMGILADHFGKANRFSALGCVLVATGFVLPDLMSTAIVIGIGNGLFHVGGGCEVMHATPDHASLLGVFVAPGAIGLYLGTLLGKRTAMFSIPVALALTACALVCLLLSPKNVASDVVFAEGKQQPFILRLIAAALFLVVVLRSLSGMLQNFGWKSGVLAFFAVLCTAGGKALGGILADRFGFRLTTVLSLGVGGALFLLSNHAIAGLAAILLFNMTMPLTLFALSARFPSHKGATFGLLTLALFVGFLPQYLGVLPGLESRFALCAIALISLVLLFPCVERSDHNGR